MNDHLTKSRPVASLANDAVVDTPVAEPARMYFERPAQLQEFDDNDQSMTRAVMDCSALMTLKRRDG